MKYFTRIVDSMIKFRVPTVTEKRDLKPVYGEVFYESLERFDSVDHGKNADYDHVKSGQVKSGFQTRHAGRE